MKKYFSYLMLALTAVFFSCEDVPEPYGINLSKTPGETIAGQVLNESFAKSAGTFTSKAVNGSYQWTWTSQGGGCMKVTSYDSNTKTDNPADIYLVSKSIQLTDEAYHVTFNYILRYTDASIKDNHTVLISTDYAGDPAAATWEKLDYDPVQGSDWNTWADADLAIPASYQGKAIYLALRYLATSKAATWEVKNLVVAQGNVGGGGDEPGPSGDDLINETFAKSAGTFKTDAAAGAEYNWAWTSQGGGCMKVTSYDSNTKTNNAADVFLISPQVTFGDESYVLKFDYILRYALASAIRENHTILISKNYNGKLEETEWETLEFAPVEVSDWNSWTTVEIAIPESYQGKTVSIAFHYIGTTEKASTWEVKNVVLTKGTSGGDTPGGDTGETKTLPYEESFSSDFGAFTQQLPSGSGAWVIDYSTAKATGYNSSTKKTTAGTYFLISPNIDLKDAGNAHVGYEYILRYNKGNENQQVLMSANYEGDATKATWITLKKDHTEGSDWNTFSSADVTVPESFIGKAVRIAFVYNTNSTSGSTWEVKNFSIKSGVGTENADGSEYSAGGSTPDPTPTPAGEAKGTGTLEDPFNFVAATNVASALANGVTSTESYYIKGKISEIKYPFDASKGTATFYITDDGNKANGQFQIYSTFYLGNRKWADGDTQINVGDEVIIYGQVVNYNGNTPETASQKSCLYSLNGVTDGGNPNPNPNPDPQPEPGGNSGLDSFTNGDFETWEGGLPIGWKASASISNATLTQSTDAHGGLYSVCVAGDKAGNKRLAYTEMDLEAGVYNCTFWTKAATESEASLCPGHASINPATGKITYVYDQGADGKNKYVNNIGSSWQKVSYTITLNSASTVALVIMNSKSTGTNLLIDDFEIAKQ